MTTEFTIGAVVKILGIPRERFKAWVWEKHVVPSIKSADGLGTVNKYSISDVYGIGIFNYLVEKGLSRATASYIYRQILRIFDDAYFEARKFEKENLFIAVLTRSNDEEPKRSTVQVLFISDEQFSSSFREIFLEYDGVDLDAAPENFLSYQIDDVIMINATRLFKEVSTRMP